MAKGIEYRNALPPGTRLHEFEFQDVLGSGGFGVTYRGFDHVLGKPVAIKEYLPSDLAVRANGNDILPKSTTDQENFDWGLDRFLEEARAIAKFNHPNLIRVHRFFEANNTGYIVMDYAEGETLGSLLKRERVLTPSRLGELLFPLLDGLESMHRADLLHRDIKPDNIIVLEKDGSPVIIDFGAARQAINTKSRSVTAIVTPGYAPIEQYSTRGAQGPSTDIYALAAVAYRAIVGERPDDSTNRLTDDKLEGWVHRVRGWDRAFLEAVDNGLAFNGADRPQTVAEWRAMLFAGGAPVEQPAESRGSLQRRLTGTGATGVFWRFGTRWVAPVGAACALAFSVFWFWTGEGDPPIGAGNDVVGPPPPPPPDPVLEEIEDALNEGWARLDDDALTIPEDNNAVLQFERVLELDPGNTEAQGGLAAVAERYGELIGSAIGEGNCGLAIQRLENLNKLNDTHPEILGLSVNIAFLRAETNMCEEDSTDPPPPPPLDIDELCDFTLPEGAIVHETFERWWGRIEAERVCCQEKFQEITTNFRRLNLHLQNHERPVVEWKARCTGHASRVGAGPTFILPPEAP